MCSGNRGFSPGFGPRRRGRGVPRSRQAAPAAVAAMDNATAGCSCSTTPTPAQELYGVRQQQNLTRTCCDVYCGCRNFPADARDSFWPGFAHPRWLPCNQLYNSCED